MTGSSGPRARADVLVVSPGHAADRVRLQPWAYIERLAAGLTAAGCRVDLAPAGGSSAERPATAVWSVGPTSMLRTPAGKVARSADRVVAVVPGPLYTLGELRRSRSIGFTRGQRDHAVHALAAAVPRRAFARFLARAADAVVVPTPLLARQLLAAGLAADGVHVVPCGKDPAWDAAPPAPPAWLGETMGDGPFAVNFGPLRAVRGVHELARAARVARVPCLFLARPDPGDPGAARLRAALPQGSAVHEGHLDAATLRAVVARARLAAFPFRLVQSIVPLAILESMQAGVPLVTTNSGPLPDLVGDAGDASAAPCDPRSLAISLQAMWEPDRAARCAAEARRRMQAHPTWLETGRAFARIVEGGSA